MIGLAIVFLGIVNIISRRSVVGMVLGLHFVMLGMSLLAVSVVDFSLDRVEAVAFGVFLVVLQTVVVASGYAISIRLFYNRRSTAMKNLNELRG